MAAHPYTHLSPADAAVAARSLGRRFREAAAAASTTLDDEPDEAELDEVAGRPGADGRSALDHLALAAHRLEVATERTRGALVDRAHVVPAELLDTAVGAAPTHSGHLQVELDRVADAGVALAEVVEGADAALWGDERRAADGSATTPLAVVQTTVAFVLDCLTDLSRTLREVRGRG